VRALAAVAMVLLAALIAFVALVEHAPAVRVAALVEAREGPDRPKGEPLVAKLFLAPATAASVRPGVAIKLAFRAYPRERFGLFEATVDSVDAIQSLPGEVLQAGAGAGAPMFVATASLPGALRGPHGEALSLKPGMRADALVPTERRPLLEWLLDPSLRDGGKSRAFAEAAR
jgi:membrane fusion protein